MINTRIQFGRPNNVNETGQVEIREGLFVMFDNQGTPINLYVKSQGHYYPISWADDHYDIFLDLPHKPFARIDMGNGGCFIYETDVEFSDISLAPNLLLKETDFVEA